MIWSWLSFTAMTLSALTHSVLGEQRLIGPILALDGAILQRLLARRVLRFAWHFTSALMMVSALLVVWPGTPWRLVAVTGAIWLAVGLFDAVYSRGRHVGWPMLSAAGAFAILGAAV